MSCDEPRSALLARLLGVADRTRFLNADAFAVDWSEYDALYFYNPFELAVFRDAPSAAEQSIQIARARQKLAALPNCTRVVTFHGFGGVMPARSISCITNGSLP